LATEVFEINAADLEDQQQAERNLSHRGNVSDV
jgi:hypothetical protein